MIGQKPKPTPQQEYDAIEAIISDNYWAKNQGNLIKQIIRTDSSFAITSTDGMGYNVPLKHERLIPKPYIDTITPVSVQPSATSTLTIKGSYFTPNTTIAIPGQTVSDFKFVSDNEVTVKVTTGATQSNFDITVNNGSATTLSNGLLVTLQEVIVPKSSDFNLVTGSAQLDLTNDGIVKLKTDNTPGAVRFFNVPIGQDFQLRFRAYKSLVSTIHNTTQEYDLVSLYVNGQLPFKVAYTGEATGIIGHPGAHAYGGITYGDEIMLERIGTAVKLYVKGVYKLTFTSSSNTGTIEFQVNLHRLDIGDIKYIKL